MAGIVENALGLVGDTPLVRLNRLPATGAAAVLAKVEARNPGGSVKDRIALAMVEEAEAQGKLRPGDTIVEPTSGNTGIGLAVVAAVKGYRLVLTMPDDMSLERRTLLSLYGAELVLTPAIEVGRRCVESQGSWGCWSGWHSWPAQWRPVRLPRRARHPASPQRLSRLVRPMPPRR